MQLYVYSGNLHWKLGLQIYYFWHFSIFEFLKLFTDSYFRVITFASLLLSSFSFHCLCALSILSAPSTPAVQDVLSSCLCLFCHCIDGGFNECCAHASARNLLHRNRHVL